MEWYCSEPSLPFNKTVVTGYPNLLERRYFAHSTINLRLAAAQQLSHEASLAGFSAWILLQESEG